MSTLQAFERKVITINGEASIKEAAKLMRDNNVGDIIVVKKQGNASLPIGVITDRDIAIHVGDEEFNLETMTVHNIMSDHLLVLNSRESMKEALVKMSEKSVRRAPITDENGKLIGITTLDDLLILLVDELSHLAGLVHKQGKGKQLSW